MRTHNKSSIAISSRRTCSCLASNLAFLTSGSEGGSTEEALRSHSSVSELGTPADMAPEQHRDSHSVEASADVYSLGCIFYELVTGSRAADGIDYSMVPARFHYMLRVSIQPEPAQRFQSAVELLRELEIAAGNPRNSTPAEELTELFDAVLMGDDRADDLYRVLNSHSGDLDLFINTLASAPEVVSARLAERSADFRWLIRAFDRHADGEFPSSAVDRIAYFLLAVTRVTSDDDVRLMALERALLLAYQHERLLCARQIRRSSRIGAGYSFARRALEQHAPAASDRCGIRQSRSPSSQSRRLNCARRLGDRVWLALSLGIRGLRRIL